MDTKQTILYAEDDPDEVFLLNLGFKKLGFPHTIQHVSDGQQAIDYLSGTNHFADRQQFPLPAVLLLDLKMPGIDGFQVLEWLQTQPRLQHLPVLVLTSSDFAADRTRALELGAAAFLTKSLDWAKVVNVLRQLLPAVSQPIVT